MKKLIIFIIAFLVPVFTFSAFNGKNLALAEELVTEEITETVEEKEKQEEVVKTEQPVISKEELTQIIESVLSEEQKNFAQKTATLIAEKFGLNVTTIYIIIACIIGVFVIAFVLIGKIVQGKSVNAKVNEKLKAVQAVLSDKEQTLEKLTDVLQNLDKDKLTALILEALNGVKTEFSSEVVQEVVKGLKLDTNSIASLLSNAEITNAQIAKVIEALKILAKDAGRDDMCATLATAPTVETVNKLEMENALLKTALGEEAVKEVLKNDK